MLCYYLISEKVYIWYRMMNLKVTNHKKLLARFMLVSSLFFSFFTIAGYSVNSRYSCRQDTQAESVYVKGINISSRIVLYKNCIVPKEKIKYSFSKTESATFALFQYSRLVKTKLRIIQKDQLSFQSVNCFIRLSKIATNAGEDEFTFSV